MSSYQYELKNAYIWEVIEISSDLRWATLAWLQAQWWTDIWYVSWRPYVLDSSWLYPQNNIANSRDMLYRHIPELTSTSKIKIHCTGYTTRNYSSGSYQYCSYISLWVADITSSFVPSVWEANWLLFVYNASNPINDKYKCWIYCDQVMVWSAVSWATAGNVDLTAEIDLSTKKMKYTITSPVSATTTWTLTDAQLSSILWYKNVWAIVWCFDWSERPKLYTVDITVEI